MTPKQITKRIAQVESELRQFVRWRDETLTVAAELALDIDEAKERLENLKARKQLLTRRENQAKAARRNR